MPPAGLTGQRRASRAPVGEIPRSVTPRGILDLVRLLELVSAQPSPDIASPDKNEGTHATAYRASPRARATACRLVDTPSLR
jgi:hypothetical protein